MSTHPLVDLIDEVIFNTTSTQSRPPPSPDRNNALMVLLPILIVLSTLLFLLVLFIICALILRKRRGISLSDHDGPVDLSREDLMEGAGGFAGVESRWLENATEDTRRSYQQAKGAHLLVVILHHISYQEL